MPSQFRRPKVSKEAEDEEEKISSESSFGDISYKDEKSEQSDFVSQKKPENFAIEVKLLERKDCQTKISLKNRFSDSSIHHTSQRSRDEGINKRRKRNRKKSSFESNMIDEEEEVENLGLSGPSVSLEMKMKRFLSQGNFFRPLK